MKNLRTLKLFVDTEMQTLEECVNATLNGVTQTSNNNAKTRITEENPIEDKLISEEELQKEVVI